MADLDDTRARRALIVELVRTRHIATQGDLRDLLRARGHDVTQATLSRDLAKLGARRVALPSGGTAYEVEGFTARAWEIPPGCCAAYYPEASGLIAASVSSAETRTPLYKEMPVRVTAAA